MNVLQILPELNVGGVERGTVDLARYLAKEGHKSIVISWGGRLEEELDSFNIRHYKLPVHKKSPLTMFRMISKVAWIMKNEEVDIVHARSRVPAIIALFAYRRYVANRPLDEKSPVSFITTCHGYYNTHVFSKIMAYGKLVIVASNVIGRHMTQSFKVPLEHIRLIPRGVDTNKFFYKSPDLNKTSDFVVGMVSRITPWKGHETFLKAMSKLVRIFTKSKIIIGGSVLKGKEDYKRKLDLLVKLLGLEKHAKFIGLVEDVPSFMHKLDLLVSASNTSQETFGRVIIEAFSCGVPVLATKIGGAAEIITHMKDGILVPVDDPNAMVEQAKNILEDRKLSMQLSKNARLTVEEKYSLKKMMDSTVKVYKEASCIFRILLIKMDGIGDIILSLPLIEAIREKFEDATIHVVTSLKGREVLSKSELVDETIICQHRSNDKVRLKYLWDFSKKLRREIFDLAIDLQNDKQSHFISYFSGAANRYGYRSSQWDFFLNHAVKRPDEMLEPVDYQGYLLKSLGIPKIKQDIEINIPAKDQDYIDNLLMQEWLKPTEVLVALHPFANLKWDTKNWIFSRYAELVDKLAQNNIRTVITGDNTTTDLIYKLCRLTSAKPINFAGKTTILQLAALFKHCKLVIVPDSAPMYLASAVKTPCIALFGPTDPARHVPKGADVKVIRKHLHCAPCYKTKCQHKSCMEQITLEEVFNAVINKIYN